MHPHLSALALIAGAVLAGCATSGEIAPTPQEEALATELQSRSIVPATAEERSAIANQDLLTQAAFWAEAYDLNPGDREAATQLADVVRQLGNPQRAAEIARQALALYPQDASLQRVFGLALTATGRGEAAIEPLSRAAASNPGDWQILNALGVALEQAGRSTIARERFTQALLMAPDEPAVLSNLALSHALAGQPEQAEALLRRAMNNNRATPQVRQNLALVLALQGRFAEAEEVALLDTTPDMAAANMAYVRDMMSSPRRWDTQGAQGYSGSR